uniref:Uncharacterized protein n=1 Tax=Myotis myotis TaxID=51298 RepID=A0A7J7WHU1_MYOMY|nr:hypothetical protein mMyoMyo1_012159 [Myotis myotis]
MWCQRLCVSNKLPGDRMGLICRHCVTAFRWSPLSAVLYPTAHKPAHTVLSAHEPSQDPGALAGLVSPASAHCPRAAACSRKGGRKPAEARPWTLMPQVAPPMGLGPPGEQSLRRPPIMHQAAPEAARTDFLRREGKGNPCAGGRLLAKTVSWEQASERGPCL